MPEPGFYPDIPEADYHGDRDSLSVSGAKTLLRAPALFRYEQDHPVHKDVFDFGTAAHALVLGVGADLVIHEYDAEKVRSPKATNAWKDQQAEVRKAGGVLLLPEEHDVVQAMADELSGHKLAMDLLSDGQPEVSAYAPDEHTGIMRRCRYDWLRDDLGVDYKSCADASPGGFGRAVAAFGYHQQHPWYLDLARDLGQPLKGFVFIAQMKTPPYLIGIYELEPEAVAVGRDLNRRALERFRDCRDSGLWPGFVPNDQITPIDIPRWAYTQGETA
jgi:hypothetical protein